MLASMVRARSPVRLSRPRRRQRILDAAVEAFAARGYEAASMSEIAASAGITKPVLYDHFASKRDLFVELMESVLSETERAEEMPTTSSELIKTAVTISIIVLPRRAWR